MGTKRRSREEKEQEVLLGLVSLFIETGHPVGSNTLKDNGFKHLSSATIRNYFARLETEGFLKQNHASGGRVPTDKGYRFYAKALLAESQRKKEDDLFISSLLKGETREISPYLQRAAEAISELTGCAAFIAAPRFDQDFIVKMQLANVDDSRALCIILTDFGLIHTETLYLPEQAGNISLEKIEKYFTFRLTGVNKPSLSGEEETFAKHSYNEVVLRHFVNYTNVYREDIYKAGFSKLLLHPEFYDPEILSNTLSLFENNEAIREILLQAQKEDSLKTWIGDDLSGWTAAPYYSSIIAVPYKIHNKTVGVIALLGPTRLPYAKIFGVLEQFSHYISETLTDSMYKFKIHYRRPRSQSISFKEDESKVIGLAHKTMLEGENDKE